MLKLAVAEARKLAEKIKKRGGELVGATANLVDIVWGADRPSRPKEKVTALDIQFSGKHHREKIEDLRKELEKQKSAGFVVCKFGLGPPSCPESSVNAV